MADGGSNATRSNKPKSASTNYNLKIITNQILTRIMTFIVLKSLEHLEKQKF